MLLGRVDWPGVLGLGPRYPQQVQWTELPWEDSFCLVKAYRNLFLANVGFMAHISEFWIKIAFGFDFYKHIYKVVFETVVFNYHFIFVLKSELSITVLFFY